MTSAPTNPEAGEVTVTAYFSVSLPSIKDRLHIWKDEKDFGTASYWAAAERAARTSGPLFEAVKDGFDRIDAASKACPVQSGKPGNWDVCQPELRTNCVCVGLSGNRRPTRLRRPLQSPRHTQGKRGMSAIISDCGKYRYRLERHGLSGAGAIAWIMVNPSTADASQDDATIRKVIGFSERLGAGWLIVGNKFAYRATDVRELRTAPDPRGPENDCHLADIMQSAPTVIAAWGPLSKLPPDLRKRWTTVRLIAARLGVSLWCLGTAQDGQPRHPLMLAYDTPLVPWKAP